MADTSDENRRSLSVDAFRGLAVAGMIMVNMPGSWRHVYPALRHADWNGCGAADLVFPFFLFISGVSIAFSRLSVPCPKGNAALRIARRVAVLFLAGLFLNFFPHFGPAGQVRIMGVLQRIALAWGLAAVAAIYIRPRRLAAVSAAVLLAHWAALLLFGGKAPFSLESNLARAVDIRILGEAHMWHGKGSAFDPEGVLGTLPAAVTVLTGFLTGLAMRRDGGARVPDRIAVWGAASAAAGLLWGIVFPVNKYLWTGSFVLLTSGPAAVLLYALDRISRVEAVARIERLPAVLGRNALAGFIISAVWARVLYGIIKVPDGQGGSITGYTWLYERIFVPAAGEMKGSLLFALAHVVIIWLILYPLYRKKIMIRV